MYSARNGLKEGNRLASHQRREWVAFGFIITFLGVMTAKKLARGTANDAAASQHRASTITTLKEQFGNVAHHASHVVAASKLQGKELGDQVKVEVEQYQADIKPSLERIQGNLAELSAAQTELTQQQQTPPAQ